MNELNPVEELYSSFGFEKPKEPQEPAKVGSNAVDSLYQEFGFSAPKQQTAPVQPAGSFWGDTAQSAATGLAQGYQRTRQLAGGLASKATGGQFFPQQAEAPIRPFQVSPETDTEVKGLLQQPISEGWTNPRWYASHITAGLTGSWPELTAGALGEVAAGPVGAIGAFSGASGALSLIPSYNAAKARGEDDDTAIRSAIVDSGIDMATAAAMGIIPSTPLVQDTVRKAVSGPVKEAMVNLGLVVPAVGEIGSQTKSIVDDGKLRGPDEVLTDWTGNLGLAGVLVGAHALGGKAELKATPATPADVGAAFQDVTRQPKGADAVRSAYRAATGRDPDEPITDRSRIVCHSPCTIVTPPDELGFYSSVRRLVESKGPGSATGEQWNAFLRNAQGVKAEELEWLRLPAYLADAQGKVSREDILTHIEDNAIHVTEKQLGLGAPHPDDEWIQKLGERMYGSGVQLDTMSRMNIFPKVMNFLRERGFVEDSARYQKWFTEKGAEVETTYGAYVLPGEHANYKETLFHWSPAEHEKRATMPQQEADYKAQLAFTEERRRHGNNVDQYGRWIGEGIEPTSLRTVREQAEHGFARLTKEPTKGFEAPHFGDSGRNLLAHARTTDRMDRDGKRTRNIEEIQSDWHQKGREEGYATGPADLSKWSFVKARGGTWEARNERGQSQGYFAADDEAEARAIAQAVMKSGVPDAPFKKNWEELVLKRLLRQAADDGIERITWTNGEQQIARYPGLNERQKAGQKEFYDVKIPSIAKALAKKLGMEWGTTSLDNAIGYVDSAKGRREQAAALVHYIDLNPLASERIQAGFSLFSVPPTSRVIEERNLPQGAKEKLAARLPVARKVANAIFGLAKSMKLDAPLVVNFTTGHELGGNLGMADRTTEGYVIHIAVDLHSRETEMYTTLAHEYGHVVLWHWLEKAPWPLKLQVLQEWRKWREEVVQPGTSFAKALTSRNTAVSNYYDSIRGLDERPFNSLTEEQQRYWTSFEEYLAEHVARWATTSEKPLRVVEQFFHGISRRLLQVYNWWKQKSGQEATPNFFIKSWLDSFVTDAAPFAANTYAEMSLKSQRVAQRSLDRDGSPDVVAVPLQGSSLVARAVSSSGGPAVPPEAGADAAHADRFGWVYKWMTSLPQLAEVNPLHVPLQYYRNLVNFFNVKVRQSQEIPNQVMKNWRRLHGPQSEAVAGLIDDYGNHRFLSEDEMKRDVKRMPTEDEFRKMVTDNKVSTEGLAVFRQMNAHVDGQLDEVGRILKNEAAGIADPQKRQEFVDSIDKAIAEERKGPYFPFMHDGDYGIEVQGAVGETLYHTRRRTKKAQMQALKDIREKLQPGQTAEPKYFPKDAKPLSGIPGSMLDMIAQNLSLSDSQRAALGRLKAEQKPQIGMIQRIRRRETTPGWSQDLMRSYANYAFHTGRFFARAEYSPRFREYMQQAAGLKGNNAGEIAAFMQKHYKYMMDPTADFAILRGLIFNLRLGFSPTTAGLYLTQTPLGTYPWLAHHFGDVKALKYLSESSTRRANYWKRGTIAAATEPEMKARSEAAKRFVLDGGAAPELAAIAENANLTANTARGAVTRGWMHYQEAAGTMLHWADTANRRWAFDAAQRLAMDNPNVPYLKRVKEAYPLDYQRLLREGWTEQEAGAYLAGQHTVEQTHFVYQRTHRPQIMWGKSSALLMFQFWKQNMLFTLYNYPGVRMRSLMVMAGMAGALGLPGAKDLLGLIQAVGYQLFGKDWNLEREMRSYVLDHWGAEREQLADSLLHGLSRYGMGVPTVLDLLGHSVGLPKLPTVDRSSAIGLGDILPVNLGEALGPNRDQAGAMARTAQDVAGAAFAYPFDLYKFLTDAKLGWGDIKRYEQVIPHWMSNISRAYRWGTEGMERDRNGNPIAKFDANDPTQMMEILARALGYTPTRVTQTYERRTAEMEIKAFWQLRREGLMRQAWDARRVKDTEQYQRVVGAIRKFNDELPPEMKGTRVTPEQLLQFMRNKATQNAMVTQGLPAEKKDIPLARRVNQMYPVLEQSSVGVR